MLRSYKIIPLLFLFSSLANAKVFAPDIGTSYECKVEVLGEKRDKTTHLTCPNLKFKLEQSFMDNKFLRWVVLKTNTDYYITLFFTKGVHGERAIIFSKKTQKQIANLASAWPIEIEKRKEQLRLNYKKDSNKKGEFPSHYYNFK